MVLAFRGTKNIADFITDAEVWRMMSPHGTVHSGFWMSLMTVYDNIAKAVKSFPPQPLIVTGHSLGGALAMLFTYRWVEPEWPVAFTYTFGQPRVGNAEFAGYYKTFHSSNTFRLVHEEDIVPRVPGLLAGFRHCGREMFMSSFGDLREGASLWWKIISDGLGLWRAYHRKPYDVILELLEDHKIDNYIEWLEHGRSSAAQPCPGRFV